MSSTITLLDPFELRNDSRHVACVGTNGGTFNQSILEGFRDSVQIMCKAAYETGWDDAYIYPILFSARHSIELYLKILIELCIKIYEIKDQVGKISAKIDITKIIRSSLTHDIEALNSIIKNDLLFDARIKDKYLNIENLLEIYYIDPEGDLFRYASDRDGIKMFENKGITHIDIDRFEEHFGYTDKMLHELLTEVSNYYEEYETGTFTKNLSRFQLEQISKELPPFSEWAQESFKRVKENIKSKYSISSNELSEAIQIIKDHIEFAANIETPIKYRSIRQSTIKTYIEFVDKSDSIFKTMPSTVEFSLDEYDGIPEEVHQLENLRTQYAAKISDDDFCRLLAFHEMGHMDIFPEKIDLVFDEYEASFYHAEHKIGKIQRKANCIKILHGLKKCGQTELLNIFLSEMKNYNSLSHIH